MVREAVALLGNDPDGDLACAYCEAAAETWDHVFATVKDSRFSGHGHRLGNLLPCCKPCNSRKGNKHWRAHLDALPLDGAERARRGGLIDNYLQRFSQVDEIAVQTADHQRLDAIRHQVLTLMAEADRVAERVRTAAATT